MNIFKNIKNGIKATTPKEKKVVKGQDLPVISRILKNFAMDKDKGVIGGYNNSFPLSTATQGNVYFLPATGKYYYCQTSYNGTQISAPNSNFVEISVLANHDRLNNLIEIYQNEYEGYIKFSNGYCRQWGVVTEKCQSKTITLPISFKDTNYNIQVSHHCGQGQTTDLVLMSIAVFSKNQIIINKARESAAWTSWSAEGYWK